MHLSPSNLKVVALSFLKSQVRHSSQAGSPNFWFFVVCRLLVGLFVPAISVNMSILISELTLPRHRAISVCALYYSWSICLGGLSLIAYLTQNWKHTTLICMAPFTLSMLSFLYVPESIRWLNMKNQNLKAMTIVRKIGKVNKKPLNESIILEEYVTRVVETARPTDLFKTRKMAKLSSIQAIMWLAVVVIFYGQPLAADDINSGSMYINFFLTCIVELPSLLVAPFVLNRFGRRRIMSFCLCVSGTSMICMSVMPNGDGSDAWGVGRIILGIVSHFTITIAHASVFTWTAEIYPTRMRSMGLSFTFFIGKAGSIVTPYILKATKSISPFFPFCFVGSLGFVAATAVMWLPETKDRDLCSGEQTDTNSNNQETIVLKSSVEEDRHLS